MLSIGWNPTFSNEKRTVEAYLCHDFEDDFYGASMHLIVCGYVRPQVCPPARPHARSRTAHEETQLSSLSLSLSCARDAR